MNRPLRIGVLGAARIAPPAVIAPAADRDDVIISAVAARDPGRAQAFATQHGVESVAEDYAALVTRPDVDLVYNALPPSAHLQWTIAALEAGKAVLCEKPFAMNADEARAMVAAAERCGRPLIEAFHYRFHNVMRRAEAIVKSGALGPLLAASGLFEVPIARTPDELRWRRALGGGGLMDLGCYPLHALRTLTGLEPQIVSAEATFEDGVDSRLRAALRFGDIEAEIACSMISPIPAARLTLTGTNGTLEIDNFIAPQVGARLRTVIDGAETLHPVDGPTTYAAQMDHVVEVLAGRAVQITGGEDAVANMAAIDALYAAAGRPAV